MHHFHYQIYDNHSVLLFHQYKSIPNKYAPVEKHIYLMIYYYLLNNTCLVHLTPQACFLILHCSLLISPDLFYYAFLQ